VTVRVRAKGTANLFKHVVEILFTRFGRHTQHAKAHLFQHPLTAAVRGAPLTVHAAVNFDDQALGGTVEIHNEVSDPCLPPEFPTHLPSVTERVPQQPLTRRLSLP